MGEYDKKTMTVKEFSELMGIGYIKAYELTRSKGFPCIKVGKKILIITSKIDEWIENSIGNTF